MGDWMKTARANARAMDQAMQPNPYRERLRRAGEEARRKKRTVSVQTASKPAPAPVPAETTAKVNKVLPVQNSQPQNKYLLSDDLKAIGESLKTQYEKYVEKAQAV